MVQQFGNGFAILTPAEWIDICQLRRASREQHRLRRRPRHLAREGTDAAAIALGVYQLPIFRVDSFPLYLTSEAGLAAWFVAALVSSWLGIVTGD